MWGVVLNDVQTEIAGYAYSHYYTHYYGEETPATPRAARRRAGWTGFGRSWPVSCRGGGGSRTASRATEVHEDAEAFTLPPERTRHRWLVALGVVGLVLLAGLVVLIVWQLVWRTARRPRASSCGARWSRRPPSRRRGLPRHLDASVSIDVESRAHGRGRRPADSGAAPGRALGHAARGRAPAAAKPEFSRPMPAPEPPVAKPDFVPQTPAPARAGTAVCAGPARRAAARLAARPAPLPRPARRRRRPSRRPRVPRASPWSSGRSPPPGSRARRAAAESGWPSDRPFPPADGRRALCGAHRTGRRPRDAHRGAARAASRTPRWSVRDRVPACGSASPWCCEAPSSWPSGCARRATRSASPPNRAKPSPRDPPRELRLARGGRAAERRPQPHGPHESRGARPVARPSGQCRRPACSSSVSSWSSPS